MINDTQTLKANMRKYRAHMPCVHKLRHVFLLLMLLLMCMSFLSSSSSLLLLFLRLIMLLIHNMIMIIIVTAMKALLMIMTFVMMKRRRLIVRPHLEKGQAPSGVTAFWNRLFQLSLKTNYLQHIIPSTSNQRLLNKQSISISDIIYRPWEVGGGGPPN